MKKDTKFHYVKRINAQGDDLGVVEIPDRYLTSTLKNNPRWFIESSIDLENLPIETNPPVIKLNELQCPLCGKQMKDERGLKIHKSRMHS